MLGNLRGVPTCNHGVWEDSTDWWLLHHVPAQTLQLFCRFLVLVTGTLVYGKGDKMEARREGLLEAGEERLFAPVSTVVPGETQPSAMPGHRRCSIGTAPIAMRATPGSLKVRCPPFTSQVTLLGVHGLS